MEYFCFSPSGELLQPFGVASFFLKNRSLRNNVPRNVSYLKQDAESLCGKARRFDNRKGGYITIRIVERSKNLTYYYLARMNG